jgi:hypothetical protein
MYTQRSPRGRGGVGRLPLFIPRRRPSSYHGRNEIAGAALVAPAAGVRPPLFSPSGCGGGQQIGPRSGAIWGQSRVPMEPTVKARAVLCYSAGGGQLFTGEMNDAL